MKYCSDFEGECCTSCHYEWEDGYQDPLEVYDKDNNLVALVCCAKVDTAKKELE